MKFLKQSVVAAALMAAASLAQAQSSLDGMDEAPSAAAMAFDAVIVRPLGLVATVAGIGLFIVHLPFSLIAGEPPSDPARRLIAEPAAYTFTRPLGEMQ